MCREVPVRQWVSGDVSWCGAWWLAELLLSWSVSLPGCVLSRASLPVALWHCCSVRLRAPCCKRDPGWLEQGQRRATKVLKGLEGMTYDEER